MKKVVLILLSLGFLSACMTTHYTQGSKVDESLVAKIEKNQTTRNQIREWFGFPDRVIGIGVRDSEASADYSKARTVDGLGVGLGQDQELYLYEFTVVRNCLIMFTFGIIGKSPIVVSTKNFWI